MIVDAYLQYLNDLYGLDEDDNPSQLHNDAVNHIAKCDYVVAQVVMIHVDTEAETILQMRDWCNYNCSHKVSDLFGGIDWFFENEEEAMLFKLTWC
jgi:hypothetical protein